MISLTGLFALLSLSSGAITAFSVVALVALYGVQVSAANAALSAYLRPPPSACWPAASSPMRPAAMPRSPRPGSVPPRRITFTIGTFDLGVVLLLPAMAAAGLPRRA